MAGNIDPIFSKAGDIQFAPAITAANTAVDGTGTVVTAFTADATNGGWVDFLRLSPAGTNVPTVAHIFINNGATNATAGNNTYIGQVTLPATTASNTASIGYADLPLGFALPPGYKINVVLATAVAAGWQPTVFGGKY